MAGIFVTYEEYSQFVAEMQQDMWNREQIAVDNTNTNLTATQDLLPGATGNVITITCPPGRVMSIMGTQQVSAGADRATAHAFWMRMASGATEINELIHVNIQKTTPSTAVVPLIKDVYQSLCIAQQHNRAVANAVTGDLYKNDDQIHRFRKGIILYGQETLQIQLVNTVAQATTRVVGTQTQFSIDMDLWTKTV